MSRATRWALLVCLPLWLGGCEDESGSGGDSALGRDFMSDPYGDTACDTFDRRLDTRRELRLFANRGIDPERTARALQRYFKRFGITFHTTRVAELLDLNFVHDLDNKALNDSLRAQFPGIELTDESLTELEKRDPALFNRILRAVFNFQFRGAVTFMNQYGREGQGVTNLVLMNDLFTPASPKEMRDGVLGISMSPFLFSELRRQGMDEFSVFSALDFPSNFSPVVFIGDANVAALERAAGAVHRDLVAAHEFGHSGGLVHLEDRKNLMNPTTNGKETCAIALNDQQITTLQQGLGISPQTATKSLQSGLGSAEEAGVGEKPLYSAKIVAGVLRGDPEAQRAFLPSLHNAH
jgi:Matrixin